MLATTSKVKPPLESRLTLLRRVAPPAIRYSLSAGWPTPIACCVGRRQQFSRSLNSEILDMGDIANLLERAEEKLDKSNAEAFAQKALAGGGSPRGLQRSAMRLSAQ
jgi:hypothetical protein